MLFSETLKLRPELRIDPAIINRIEKLIDLPRVEKAKGGSLDPERVRSVVA
jgi:hypothetical protein